MVYTPGTSPTATATPGPAAVDPNPLGSIQQFFDVNQPWVYLIAGAVVLYLVLRKL